MDRYCSFSIAYLEIAGNKHIPAIKKCTSELTYYIPNQREDEFWLKKESSAPYIKFDAEPNADWMGQIAQVCDNLN